MIEMSKSIVVEGKTTAEAVEKGLKELKVSKDMVDIKVIEEGDKRSFYSILTPRVVKVELTMKEGAQAKRELKEPEKTETHIEKKALNQNMAEIEEASNSVKEFLEKFLKEGTSYEVKIENYEIYIDINGESMNYLIGYRGETINNLQTIISAIANKKATAKIRVYLDVAGYREKRIKTLEDLAEKIASTVIKTGKSIALEPMTAYERKIIHSKLQSKPQVKTYSKGEEPYRKIIIALNDK